MMFASRNFLLLLGMALLASMQILAEESPAVESNAETDAEEPTCEGGTCEGETDANDNDNTDGGLTPPVLPDFTHGGIFVYFHLYKTGGSSVTELMMETKYEMEEDLEEEDDEMVIFVNNREDMTVEDIENSVAMVKDLGVPVFYNFHVEFPSTMYPTLVEAAPVLKFWREEAERQGVPFFLSTTLREPLGQSLSFFNFFHVAVDEEDWSPFTGDLDPTEENYLKTFVPNRLCHLMFDDAHGILEAPDFALREGIVDDLHHFMDEVEMNRRNEPSFCDIDIVRNILFESGIFDYIGVTEKLSTHILPMYMEIVFGDHTLAHGADRKKFTTDIFEEDEIPPLRKDKVSEETKAMVARESAKDQQLYEEARDRFAHWPRYT